MIGLVLISYFTKRLFSSQVLKELYQTKYDRRPSKSQLSHELRIEKAKSVAIRPNMPVLSEI